MIISYNCALLVKAFGWKLEAFLFISKNGNQNSDVFFSTTWEFLLFFSSCVTLSSCPAGYAVGHMENRCSGGRSGERDRDMDIDTDTEWEWITRVAQHSQVTWNSCPTQSHTLFSIHFHLAALKYKRNMSLKRSPRPLTSSNNKLSIVSSKGSLSSKLNYFI